MGWNYNENDNKDFGPKLEPGPRQAVVFAVYDMGLQETVYKGTTKTQHKIRIGIELNELYTEGKFAGSRITKYPKFTLSFYENANLASAVRGILGRDMTEDEIREGGEVLIGKNFQLSITYGKNQDGTESKFPDFMYSPLMKDIQWIEPMLGPDYVPEFIDKERKEKTVSGKEQSPEDQFADPNDIEKAQKLNDLKAWRDAGIITPSQLTATTKLVCKSDIKTSEATPEQVKEIWTKLKPEAKADDNF